MKHSSSCCRYDATNDPDLLVLYLLRPKYWNHFHQSHFSIIIHLAIWTSMFILVVISTTSVSFHTSTLFMWLSWYSTTFTEFWSRQFIQSPGRLFFICLFMLKIYFILVHAFWCYSNFLHLSVSSIERKGFIFQHYQTQGIEK